VAFTRRDRIGDPVGPHLAGIVVADRHAGRDARPEHEEIDARRDERRAVGAQQRQAGEPLQVDADVKNASSRAGSSPR